MEVKGDVPMGTVIVAVVFAAFLFFILTAGYNEDKTWNL